MITEGVRLHVGVLPIGPVHTRCLVTPELTVQGVLPAEWAACHHACLD